MKMKKLVSLAIATVMTISAFAGLAVTTATAEIGDAANNIWTATASDNGKAANTVLYDDDKGTLTTLFELTATTDETKDEVVTPISETVGERTFTAFVSHPTMNGGFNTNGTLRDGYYTLFSFVPKADGVLTAYFLRVAANKNVCIVEDGATNFKSGGSLVYTAGTGSMAVSAQLEANKTYYIFVDGSKGQFAAIDYETDATYTQPTAAPEEPEELTNEWTASSKDVSKKSGASLMIGLTMLFDNSSGNSGYIVGTKAEGAAAADTSVLQYVAPDNGELTVDINQLGPGKTVIAVNSSGATVASVNNPSSTDKANLTLTVSVEKDATYKIYGKDTTARYSGAKFVAKSADELAYSWTMSDADSTKTTGAELMKGLTMQFNTDTTKTKYIIGAESGLGSALKYEAYAAGTLSVTFYQLGNLDSVKTATIYDVTGVDATVAKAGVLKTSQQTTGEGKEDITLSTSVEANHTYLIYSPDSKGSYSAASFTPASSQPDATTTPDATTAPDATTNPATDKISCVKIVATYADGALTNVTLEPGEYTPAEMADYNNVNNETTKTYFWKALKGEGAMEPVNVAIPVRPPEATDAPQSTDTPQSTEAPVVEPEWGWVASSDANVEADAAKEAADTTRTIKKGYELISGLTTLFDNASTNKAYIKGSANGEWSEQDNSTSSMLKYVPAKDGVLYIKLNELGANKEAAIFESGLAQSVIKADPEYIKTTEKKSNVIIKHEVEAGKTYLVTIKGSVGTYAAAAFVEQAVAKTWSGATKAENITNGTALFSGLTTLFDDVADSTKKYIAGDTNPTVGEDGTVTGSALQFIAPTSGTISVTITGLGAGKSAAIYDKAAKDEIDTKTNDGTDKADVTVSATVEAGKTYYIMGKGTNAYYSAASFTPAAEAPAITD